MRKINILLKAFLFFLVSFFIIAPNIVLAANINSPIYHQPYFKTEAELYGYNPGFEPNVVTFDCNNHPYIRTPDGFIQTLDDSGNWTKIDMVASARAYFAANNTATWAPNANTGQYFRDSRIYEDRVVFDDKCNAYTYLDTTSSTLKQGMLLYSTDLGKNWQTYLIPNVTPGMSATLEFKSGANKIIGPPTVLIHMLNTAVSNYNLYIIKPTVNTDGTLFINTPRLIATDSILTMNHSGAGNNVVTMGANSYVVYSSNIQGSCPEDGTVTFALTYNHTSRQVTSRQFIGCAKGIKVGADAHFNPALIVDSNGFLHAILGSHQQQFLYTKTVRPYDITSWSSPAPIGEPIDSSGGYTYASLVADSANTLHLVSRWAGRGYYFRLVYMRKPENKNWSTFINTNPNNLPGGTTATLFHKELVIPFHNFYAVWHQKLNIDNDGRLYINYSTMGAQYTDTEAAEYRKKWPNEPLIKDDPACVAAHCDYFLTTHEHGPSMLVSEDGGNTWHLAVTSDLKHFTSTPKIPGDITDAGDTPGDQVNVNDFNLLKSVFAAGDPVADIDKNGSVSIFDYNLLVENYGK